MRLETAHEYRGDVKSWRRFAEKSPEKIQYSSMYRAKRIFKITEPWNDGPPITVRSAFVPESVINVAVRQRVRERRTSTDVNLREFVGGCKNGAPGLTLGRWGRGRGVRAAGE